MNARAHQQLLLQETVEGLSVVAISYYLVALLSKFLDGLAHYFNHADWFIPEWALVPIVIVLVAFGLRRLHKRLKKSAQEDIQS